MDIIGIVYRLLVVMFCGFTLWTLLKEKSLTVALNLGIVSVPLILRALMIK